MSQDRFAAMALLLGALSAGCLSPIEEQETGGRALAIGESPGRAAPGWCAATIERAGTLQSTAASAWEPGPLDPSARVVARLDHPADPTQPDARTTLRYDALGRVDLEQTDAGLDGTIDQETARSWNDDGQLGSEVHRVLDGATMRVTIATTFTWQDGRRVQAEIDDAGDGTVEAVRTYEPAGGTLLERLVATADGRLLETVERVGQLDSPRGRTTTTRTTREGVAFLDSVLVDAFGNVLERTHDADADGTADVVVRFDYGCLIPPPAPPAPPAPAPAPRRTVSFEANVLPILTARCLPCHRAGGGRDLQVSGTASQDLPNVRAHVDTGNPEGSQLLQKSSAAVRHMGRERLPAGSPDYGTVLTWIREGAR